MAALCVKKGLNRSENIIESLRPSGRGVEPVLCSVLHLERRGHAGAGSRLTPSRRVDPVDFLYSPRCSRRLGCQFQPRNVAVRVHWRRGGVELLQLGRTQHIIHAEGRSRSVDEEVMSGSGEAGGYLRNGNLLHSCGNVWKHATDCGCSASKT